MSSTCGEPVFIRRLEDELTMRSICCVDLWKLDVEGYEIEALKGAGSYLKDGRIRAVYVELHGDNGIRIRDYLTRLGYAGFLISRCGKLLKLGRIPEHTNGLFLPGRGECG